MGFECSINRVKKNRKDLTLRDFYIINTYLDWRDNPWNFETRETIDGGDIIPAPYPTFEKYWNANCDFIGEFPGEPSQSDVDFYSKVKAENRKEFSFADASTTVNFWCSNGRYIDDEITSRLNKINEYTYEGIDKKFINDMLEWINDELELCNLTPSMITSCYKDNEDGTTTIIPCDGIVVQNPDTGEERRINTSDFDFGELIYIPTKYFDDDEYHTLISLKETLLKLSEIDFEKEIVWYERSF